MKKRLLDISIAFMFGLSILLFFGFTRDWIESTPTDDTVANQIDDYNRYLRVDTAERLEDYVSGFATGETATGFFHVLFIENAASLSTPAANKGLLYGVLANSKCELAYEDEDGDMIQLTTGGNMGGAHIELLANMDLLGSSTSDITINTDKFTVAGATGNTSVGGTFESVGVATLADASVTKTSGAPTADAQIANKKYVDDQEGAGTGYYDADGTTVFNTTMTAANTWQDLDLSSYVGSNVALVFLEIKPSVQTIYTAKPKGYGSATTSDHHHSSGFDMGGCSLHTEGNNEYGYMTLATDSSGVIQQAANDNSTTFTIKLVGYIK